MTTEALSLPALESGLEHPNQERSEAEMVGNQGVIEGLSTNAEPHHPLIPPLEDANGLVAPKNTLEELSDFTQKDVPMEKASSSPAVLSQGTTMAPVDSQLLDQGQEESQVKMPNVQKEERASRQLEQGEAGSCLESHGNILDVSPEVQGAESKLYPCSENVPVISAEFLKPLEAEKVAHDGTISGAASEQQTSNAVSHQADQRIEEDDTGGHPVKAFGACSEKPELPRNLHQIPAGEEETDGLPSPKTLDLLGLETNGQNPTEEEGCLISSHSDFDWTGELQGTFRPTGVHEERQPSGPNMTETGDEESRPNREDDRLLLASDDDQDHVNGQSTEEPVTRDCPCSPNSSSLASAGSQLDVGSCCQQRAPGTGCDTLPQQPSARSPVATNDSRGPAHQGLAPACDGQDREGLAVCESRGAGNHHQSQGEVGGECVLESEKDKEATGDSAPGEKTSQPEEAEDLTGANKLDEAFPDSPNLPGTRDPTCPREAAGAMVLARAEDLLDTRNGEDSQGLANASLANGLDDVATEHSGSNPTPGKGLLLEVANPTSARGPASPEEPTLAVPPAEGRWGTEEPDCPTDLILGNDTYEPENPSHAAETPIEREIRLHLEREDLLRKERGLGSSRGTQEYVEVCIKPILTQSMASSLKPKEKERQWAGVQMQREIQRECRREEDLVQLGKVRGTYDRGTPQELQEKKMIFEQHPHPETPDFRKRAPSSSSSSNPCVENARGPPLAEVNWTSNVVVLDSGVVAEPKQRAPGRASMGSPFVCLRAKGSQSLLDQEVREVQERERELQRQRLALYGSALPCRPAEDPNQAEEAPSQPERRSCKKLDVTWPPPSASGSIQVNGLHQVERSPRLLRRQRSALIQRWESGAIGHEENQD